MEKAEEEVIGSDADRDEREIHYNVLFSVAVSKGTYNVKEAMARQQKYTSSFQNENSSSQTLSSSTTLSSSSKSKSRKKTTSSSKSVKVSDGHPAGKIGNDIPLGAPVNEEVKEVSGAGNGKG
tara:strand:- start:469 stop:837 length:369 start_codon:yes stop_codon:yes gene_type:complete